jgi:hypothetical protein
MGQPKARSNRCNWNALAGHESTFPHWHLCDLEPGHEGKHQRKSRAEFGRLMPVSKAHPADLLKLDGSLAT